jgi:hypothetical protein
MVLQITEVHHRGSEESLNDEWFVVENHGESPVSTRGCKVTLIKAGGKKPLEVAKLEPGFTVAPGGKLRVVCGSPGTKAHGQVPEDGVENYFLFMKAPLLRWPAGGLKILKGQLVLATTEFGAPAA